MRKSAFLGFGLVLCGLFVLGSCSSPKFSLKRETPAPLVNAPLRQEKLTIPPSGTIFVQEGDTLFSLATRYQVTPQSLIADNQLSPPYALRAGDELKITPARSHIVRIEDTLYSLSQRYAVSQYQLASLNGLSEPFELVVGQRLLLPDSLDFSVLDLDGLNAANIPSTTVRQARTPGAVPSRPAAPQKSFVAPALGGAGFTWPVKGEVIAEFGPMAKGVHNDGINISAPQGSLVVTSAPGTVAFVGTGLKSFGNLVLVKHEGGYISAYAHLDDILVKEGDVLGTGTTIGHVGTTGRVSSPQLHFEIRKSRTPLNPREIIS